MMVRECGGQKELLSAELKTISISLKSWEIGETCYLGIGLSPRKPVNDSPLVQQESHDWLPHNHSMAVFSAVSTAKL